MSDLFINTEESLSPRERWVRENNITCTELEDGWVSAGRGVAERGIDRDDALARLAQRLWTQQEIKPWNMK